MRRRLNAVVVAWLVGIVLAGTAPTDALAAPTQRMSLQVAEVDPAVVELVQAGVAAAAPFVAGRALPATLAAAPDEPDVQPSIEPAPQPDPAGPQAEPTPEAPGEPDTAPLPDLADPAAEPETAFDSAEYANEELAFQAPADWRVREGEAGAHFEITAPDLEFMAAIENAALDAPGLLGVVLFVTQAEAMVAEYLEGATLTGVEVGLTGQQLPMVKLDLTADMDGVEGQAVVYLFSPGADAYLFLAFAPFAEWEAVAPGVALIADTITFDPSLITVTTAADAELVYSDEQGVLELTVPVGWQVSETGDPTLPVLVTDMTYTFAGALGIDTTFVEEVGAEALNELLNPPNAESDPDAYNNLIDALAAFMSQNGEGLTLAPEMSAAFPYDGAVTVRLAGEGDFGPNVVVPVVIYFDLRGSDAVFMIAFGDAEAVLVQEDTLLEIVRSVVALE
ncbi:MAG TPA: hypothetical protein VNK95_05725 [Caldilineaceae bacterium]|nr:hypothetical protein [Caldilineaceae bacterium]